MSNKTFTKEDDVYIIQNYGEIPLDDIEEHFASRDITRQQISQRAWILRDKGLDVGKYKTGGNGEVENEYVEEENQNTKEDFVCTLGCGHELQEPNYSFTRPFVFFVNFVKWGIEIGIKKDSGSE